MNPILQWATDIKETLNSLRRALEEETNVLDGIAQILERLEDGGPMQTPEELEERREKQSAFRERLGYCNGYYSAVEDTLALLETGLPVKDLSRILRERVITKQRGK